MLGRYVAECALKYHLPLRSLLRIKRCSVYPSLLSLPRSSPHVRVSVRMYSYTLLAGAAGLGLSIVASDQGMFDVRSVASVVSLWCKDADVDWRCRNRSERRRMLTDDDNHSRFVSWVWPWPHLGLTWARSAGMAGLRLPPVAVPCVDSTESERSSLGFRGDWGWQSWILEQHFNGGDRQDGRGDCAEAKVPMYVLCSERMDFRRHRIAARAKSEHQLHGIPSFAESYVSSILILHTLASIELQECLLALAGDPQPGPLHIL